MVNQEKEEKLNSSLKLLAKTSVFVFIGLLLSKLLGYAYRIIVARYYGPEAYGLFNLSLIIISIVIAVSFLGLSEGIARFIPIFRGKKESNKIRHSFKFFTYSLIALSLISSIILFAFSNYIAVNIFSNLKLDFYIKTLSIIILFTALSNIFLGFLRAYEKVVWSSIIFNVLQNIVKVILIIFFIFLGLGSEGIPWSYAGGIIAMAIISYLVCKKLIPEIFSKSNLNARGRTNVQNSILAYSIPMMFFGIGYLSFYWIDSLLLGYLKNAEVVGFYSAVIPLALMLTVTSEVFMQLFLPIINKEYSKKNIEHIKELSKQVAKWIFIINLPVLILLLLFPGAVINILFGKEYLVAENALRILSFGGLASSIFIISNSLLSMAGKAKVLLLDMVMATILNVILNYILIPLPKILFLDNALGINGAALATTLSILFYNTLFLIQAKKHTSIIPLRRKMLTILLSALIPTAILLYLRSILSTNLISLILISAIFFLIYILLIFITKGLDKNDLHILSAIKRKLFN